MSTPLAQKIGQLPKMKRKRIASLVGLCLLTGSVQANDAHAMVDDEAAARGLEIAKEADRRDTGYVDSEATFTMTLRDKKGRERIRSLRVKSMERPDDGDWSLTIFDNPTDVKGTAMLSYSHGLEPDDQWLYLPALKRVKRIASKNKSGPFMGSEFAFEDMSSFEIEKYSYRFLREEACGELNCFVSEWKPVYDHSGYSRIEVWMDDQEYRNYKIDFFDRNGRHLKTMTPSEYKLFNERFWRPLKLEMLNHRTGKSTSLSYDQITLGVGLSEREFDQSSLRSAK